MTETNDLYKTARLVAGTECLAAIGKKDLPAGAFVGVKHVGSGWFRVYSGVAGKSEYVGTMPESALREFVV